MALSELNLVFNNVYKENLASRVRGTFTVTNDGFTFGYKKHLFQEETMFIIKYSDKPYSMLFCRMRGSLVRYGGFTKEDLERLATFLTQHNVKVVDYESTDLAPIELPHPDASELNLLCLKINPQKMDEDRIDINTSEDRSASSLNVEQIQCLNINPQNLKMETDMIDVSSLEDRSASSSIIGNLVAESTSQTVSSDDENTEIIPSKKAKMEIGASDEDDSDDNKDQKKQKPMKKSKEIEMKFNRGFSRKPVEPKDCRDLFAKNFIRKFGILNEDHKLAIAYEEWMTMSQLNKDEWIQKAQLAEIEYKEQMEQYEAAIGSDPWRTNSGREPYWVVEEGKDFFNTRGHAKWVPSSDARHRNAGYDLILFYPESFNYFKCPVCFNTIYDCHANMVHHAKKHNVSLHCKCGEVFQKLSELKRHLDNPNKIELRFQVKDKGRVKKPKHDFECWWLFNKNKLAEAGVPHSKLITKAWKIWKGVDQAQWKVVAKDKSKEKQLEDQEKRMKGLKMAETRKGATKKKSKDAKGKGLKKRTWPRKGGPSEDTTEGEASSTSQVEDFEWD